MSPFRSLTDISIALAALLVVLVGRASEASAQREIDFAEEFALAGDRGAVLAELVPGTEEYYFYHCLHFQQTEQFEQAAEMLRTWDQRLSRTDRMREIEHRQALLQYSANPQKTLDYLIDQLDLRFDHQRQRPSAEPGLPSELDESLIARERLLESALSRDDTERIEPVALRDLAGRKLSDAQLRSLLARLTRPDVENLAQRVARDLQNRDSSGFGGMAIHSQMLLEQLKQLLALLPQLENETNFVNAWLTKLAPSNDVDLKLDRQEHLAYLERLWEYASTLNESHNSLKANILYRRLELDREMGVYDRDRFIAYLKLPRQAPWVRTEYLRDMPGRGFADLSASFEEQTRLAPIQYDEPLVRDYLHHFLVDARDWRAFSEWVDDQYLKQRFAEAKITAGLGDPEQWASMLTPETWKALMERVDLEFLPVNREFFGDDERVELTLVTKNIQNLIVKVFEVNTGNYYRRYQREIGTDISLDGLVPNWQETYRYDEAPALRVQRTFRFDQLDHRGVYVIDFIGNGTSSRALIRKGKLQHLVETTAAGYLFTILDGNKRLVPDATLWIAGHPYRADEGQIPVPFSTQASQQAIVIEHKGFHALDSFYHGTESYQLRAGLYVDREALIFARQAEVVIRPQLLAAETPVPVSLLKDVRLIVRGTDIDGIESTKTFDELTISESGETTVTIQVPARLNELKLELQATVRNISQNQDVSLSDSQSYQVNGIDKSQSLDAVHLRKNESGYVLSVRGKTGEVRRAQSVLVRLKHRDFTETVDTRLQSDKSGEIQLGPLPGIDWVSAEISGNPASQWHLDLEKQTRHETVNGVDGQPVLIPATASADTAADYSLLELRRETYLADRGSAIEVADGQVTLSGLPSGDYELSNRQTGQTVRVQITEGRIDYGFALGEARDLEIRAPNPLHVESIEPGNDQLRVHLGGDWSGARVHVLATRYLPEFDLFDQFATVGDLEPLTIQRGWTANSYLAGRSIGEEYQYILDRQHADNYPGNMLTRPSLLLNPWALRSTENDVQEAAQGDDFGRADKKAEGRASRKSAGGEAHSDDYSDFATLDFLMNGTAAVWQLRPDKNGVVEIDTTALGDKHFLRIVVADRLETVVRTVVLEEQPLKFRDLRLSSELALDPEQHFTRQKQYSVLRADELFELPDVASARFQQYESLADVYRYYLTLTGDETLREFAFLMEWPTKSDEEKFELYTQYACHELNFFLQRKDPEYFEKVGKPYLANKFHRTFVDEYLVGQSLDDYGKPWQFERLNTVERILLGRRLDGRRAEIGRFIGNDYELHPTARRDFDRLFDVAVVGGALETEGKDARFRKKSLDRDASREAPDELVAESEAGGAGGGGQDAPADAEGDGQNFSFHSEVTNREKPTSPGQAPAPETGRVAADPEGEARQFDTLVLQVDQKQSLGDDLNKLSENQAGARFGEAGEKRMEELRAQLGRYYQRVKPTQEWVENNYWHLTIEEQTAQRVQVNRFWRDLALHAPNEPFLSPYFPEAAGNFTEMVMALAVLDLPFERPESEVEFVDNAMRLTPKADLIAYFEQVRPSAFDGGGSTVLVSENFWRHDDRYQVIDGRTHEKFVRDEFLPHVLYGGQVVVTNPTSIPRDVDLLIQIPEGAMPASGSQRTRSIQMDLAPFSTQTTEYQFYFPATGDFSHYAAHVSLEDRVVAVADGLRFKVVAEPAEIDTTSWAYVSQNGTDDQVIEFLESQNLQRIDLSLIAFRMKDAAFFQRTIRALTERLAFNGMLWSYGLKHNDVAAIREYLEHAESFLAQCGPWLECELVAIHPVERAWYQHREYWPLVNGRTHQLGLRRTILNDHFWTQYHQLLAILSRQSRLDDEGRLAMTAYMLLQDRVGEALGLFEQVQPNGTGTAARLQYDYMAAYLAMYASDPDRAATLADPYRQHPVKRWRDLFASVLAQVDEIRGAESKVVDDTDTTQQQTAAAGKVPEFEFVIEGPRVQMEFQNLETVTVNYYLMDVELLFSRNPFVQQQGEGFAMIQPNSSQSIELPADSGQHSFELPDEYRTRNVLVEISGGGQTHSHASYANSMNVRLVEQFGQVQVSATESREPLPKVYVKVYARQPDGNVQFYKDGYTDLRGRFDYASLSNQNLDSVQRFAILVINDRYGAVVREATVPKE